VLKIYRLSYMLWAAKMHIRYRSYKGQRSGDKQHYKQLDSVTHEAHTAECPISPRTSDLFTFHHTCISRIQRIYVDTLAVGTELDASSHSVWHLPYYLLR